MKKERTAILALLAGLALGCPKTGQNKPASPAPSAGQAALSPSGMASPPAGASVLPSPAPTAGAPSASIRVVPRPSPAASPATAGRASEEACLDAWLAKRKLDRYGYPEGTMYTGGTPLFDERTGERKDRLTFVYARQPKARQACAGGRAEPSP